MPPKINVSRPDSVGSAAPRIQTMNAVLDAEISRLSPAVSRVKSATNSFADN